MSEKEMVSAKAGTPYGDDVGAGLCSQGSLFVSGEWKIPEFILSWCVAKNYEIPQCVYRLTWRILALDDVRLHANARGG
ncbi:MAG: hypothetical protein GX898_02355 [Corynebacterium sp.]|nr:hypothetical protein [Corynebacterium sp.]